MAEWKRQTEDFSAGCSAVSWTTEDGRHLFGRNFDFNSLAQGSGVTYVPAGTKYYTCGTAMEGTLVEKSAQTAAYACVGTGFLQIPTTPVLYEGVNEKGLMGGQLYFREFADYPAACPEGANPLQPPFLVIHMLAQCASVEEVARRLSREEALVAVPLLGAVPPLHWAFYDAAGESMVIESEKDGLHIYRNALGVMTNSPSYAWHRLNLLNYAGLRDLDYGGLELETEKLRPCFSGSGAQGLPGDWSSPSRFVRLAFLRKYAVKGRNESQGVNYLFRLLGSAAFPLGAVRVGEQGVLTELDKNVVPFDYTVYSCVMCAESGRFYWITYENLTVRYVDLKQLAARGQAVQFPLEQKAAFIPVGEEPADQN